MAHASSPWTCAAQPRTRDLRPVSHSRPPFFSFCRTLSLPRPPATCRSSSPLPPPPPQSNIRLSVAPPKPTPSPPCSLNGAKIDPLHRPHSTLLLSVAPLSLVAVAALPGAEGVAAAFEPFVELVRSWNLPELLVHWGHPGNMGVVLFAMGGYGSYLGWQIKLADDVEVKAMAKDLHPKLLAGMFFFFALGATGGIVSLLTEGKPILESSHAVTGLSGLALLTVQSLLTTFFEGNPGLRSVHGVLGSGIMLLFLVHAVFGLQLGLSS